MMKGLTSDAHQTLTDWERHDSEFVQPLWRANLLARSGHREEALKMINLWLGSNPRASIPPLALAAALLAAGEKGSALWRLSVSLSSCTYLAWYGFKPLLNWLHFIPTPASPPQSC
jgi:hypothetical protein